ncbi:MAG: hypothetical protein J6N21_06855, partial [Butyrivibrio sp.]|nr:hypothetical protein [Butyrivibrio sp.]
GRLDDWYRCYIYNNLFFYTDVTGIDSSFIKKSYEITKNLYWLIFDSFSYFVFIIAGFIIQLFGEKGIIRKVSSLIMFAMTYFVIFIGGNKLAYYSIPLMTFAIPGVAYLAGIIHSFTKNINVNKGVFLLGCMVVLGAGTAFSGFNCQSSEFRKQDKESLWLYRMASQMDIDQKTTLLNINALDVGLYTITGIVPNCEYFQTNGIGLPTMFEEQHRYIKEGVTDYVIASFSTPDNIDEHYELLTSETYYTNGEPREYYLYKKVR